MPTLHGHAVWQPTPSGRPVKTHIVGPDIQNEEIGVSCRAVTYNALALSDEEHPGLLNISRTTRPDQQFHEKKIAIIGVQEARTAEGVDHFKIFPLVFSSMGVPSIMAVKFGFTNLCLFALCNMERRSV